MALTALRFSSIDSGMLSLVAMTSIGSRDLVFKEPRGGEGHSRLGVEAISLAYAFCRKIVAVDVLLDELKRDLQSRLTAHRECW